MKAKYSKPESIMDKEVTLTMSMKEVSVLWRAAYLLKNDDYTKEWSMYPTEYSETHGLLKRHPEYIDFTDTYCGQPDILPDIVEALDKVMEGMGLVTPDPEGPEE